MNDMFTLDDERKDRITEISIYIFLGFGMVAGVAALVWAIIYLLCNRNGRKYSASIFLISLLLCDVLQLASSFLGLLDHGEMLMAKKDHGLWFIVHSQFLMTVGCGLFFHQMVALEWILSLTCPLFFSCLRSNWCSFPISLFFWVFFSVAAFTHFTRDIAIILQLGLVAVGLITVGINIITWILCFFNPPLSSYLKVLSVSTFTIVVLYGPVFIVLIMFWFGSKAKNALDVTFSVSNLRLISDPVLCVLVSMRQELQN